MRPALLILAAATVAACSPKQPVSATNPRPARAASRQRPETVTVRDPEIERRVARLELRVLEKETQVEQLQTRLDDARDEVVRTMAKLQTLASRAEAASAMAEADVALQTFRALDGARSLPEMSQATRLMRQSTSEFGRENYGGALYLANQAKGTTAAGTSRLSGANRGAARAGETPFAVPLRLKVATQGNVREGPGTNFTVVFEASAGESLTAYAYSDEWVRVADDAGRTGWIFRSLITRP
ncbi:MAG: SH3 domain-containing protein [Gemmatimonadaceae bacterium]